MGDFNRGEFMKNVRALKRLKEQGIEEKQAIRLIRDIRILGYSPERVTKEYTAKQIAEICDSVDRALDNFFKGR